MCRLQSAEVAKLHLVKEDEARRAEVAQKIAEQNKSFSEETEKKLTEKLKQGEENKSQQMRALQDRLREHVSPTGTRSGPRGAATPSEL